MPTRSITRQISLLKNKSHLLGLLRFMYHEFRHILFTVRDTVNKFVLPSTKYSQNYYYYSSHCFYVHKGFFLELHDAYMKERPQRKGVNWPTEKYYLEVALKNRSK